MVYDRWQERKSRAAGLSTDMQIAFSWLPYSAWYLSSGLQYASLFTARKQLINSTGGRRKKADVFCSAGWKYKTPQLASERCKIKCLLKCIFVLPHQKRQDPNTDISRLSQTQHTDASSCWNYWIHFLQCFLLIRRKHGWVLERTTNSSYSEPFI